MIYFSHYIFVRKSKHFLIIDPSRANALQNRECGFNVLFASTFRRYFSLSMNFQSNIIVTCEGCRTVSKRGVCKQLEKFCLQTTSEG